MLSSGRVANKVALVTGGGSGIGRAAAVVMAKEGATAIVADIDHNAAVSVVEAVTHEGGKAEAIELDVTDESAWRSAIGEIRNKHTQLDVFLRRWPVMHPRNNSG